MNSYFSFTGIVYTAVTFVFIFVTYRFFYDWKKDSTTINTDLFYTFLFLTLVCFTGTLAGTIFSGSKVGIIAMLIISSFFVTLANACLGHLFFHYKFPRISSWWGFSIIFIFGLFVTILTVFSRISPHLEESGGLNWGLPFNIYILRTIVYVLGITPVSIILIKKYQQVDNHFEKSQYLFLLMVFFIALMVVIVDFIIEPLSQAKAFLSEVTILILAIIGMFLYFVLNEKNLSRSEKRFRRLTENMLDMVCLIDDNGMIHYANPIHKEILGYELSDLKDKEFFDFVHPDDHELVKKEFSNTVSDLDPDNFEFRYIHKNGSSIWVETAGNFLLEETKKNTEDKQYAVFVSRDIAKRKKAELQIRKDLKEKKVLLQEIHHRVKNNMQVISSLLNLQSGFLEDDKTKELFQESRSRVFSMSLVHEKLYKSENLANIDFGEYINNLIKHLTSSYLIYPHQIRITYDINNIHLNINMAIPCGLIINELVSNALKYAFPENRKGEINISMKYIADNYEMIVSDNGIGFSVKIDPENLATLGLQLVHSLTKQLNGTIRIVHQKGTKFIINFKKLELQAYREI